MRVFRRRGRVPPEVLGRLGLSADERVLAAAPLDDGSTAVASSSRVLVASPERLRWSVAWHEVDAAGWEPEGRALTIDLVTGEQATLVLAEAAGSRFLEVVRDRVQSSIVLSQRVDALARRGARVVVRRGPDGLLVQVVPDPGVDLADPRVADEVERTRQQVARAVGLDGPPTSGSRERGV